VAPYARKPNGVIGNPGKLQGALYARKPNGVIGNPGKLQGAPYTLGNQTDFDHPGSTG